MNTKLTKKDNLFALLPVLAYGVGYLLNIAINGVSEYPNSNDWYGFLSFGIPGVIVMYVVLTGITLLYGYVIRKVIDNRINNSK